MELRHRRRARCEDRIRTAKDTGLRALPLHDFTQNQIWLAIVALAAQIVARHARRTVLHLADTAPWAHLAARGITRLRRLAAPG